MNYQACDDTAKRRLPMVKAVKVFVKFKGEIQMTYQFEKEEVTIGRERGNDIVIDNLGVSNAHARIVKSDDRYYIEDLDSTNGTILNGQKVIKDFLNNEDIITISKHDLEIHFEEDSWEPGKALADPTMLKD
jgi:predicted component of type VI protein secretion system